MIYGTVELIVGGLIWLLPIPGAKIMGGGLITDGLHRMIDGGIDYDDYMAEKVEKITMMLNSLLVLVKSDKLPVLMTPNVHPFLLIKRGLKLVKNGD